MVKIKHFSTRAEHDNSKLVELLQHFKIILILEGRPSKALSQQTLRPSAATAKNL